jgi:hypothetical protein
MPSKTEALVLRLLSTLGELHGLQLVASVFLDHAIERRSDVYP